ncbi:glyoxylase I 4-like [Rutidosis leptorrhynchoides]|uniref:glyoxylase I 4-like n=1 Tax=Rutidosis leptorrhynchoides TaxID=125765 RepID=UPI003A99A91F
MAEVIVRDVCEITEEIVEEENLFSSSLKQDDHDHNHDQLPMLSLNHVSFICKSVRRSVKFYEQVLGFVLIRRPSSFDFEGAWLFNHGIGIHLLEMDTTPIKNAVINPKDNHISFQCSNMDLIIKKLEELGIKYVTAVVKEGGVEVNQLFFHDPDGYMIEICNCDVLPVLPISSCPFKKLPTISEIDDDESSSFYEKMRWKNHICGEDEALIIDNLLVDMMGISF